MSATIGVGAARVRPNPDGAVRRRRPAGAAALLAAALALSGGGLASCETVYFHSDADQKAMEQARAGLDAAKKSQLDAVATQRTTLADLGTQQRAVAVRSQLALRDDTLAIIIDSPNPPKPQNWRDRVESYAKEDMVELVGAEQMPKAIFRDAVEATEPGDLFVASWTEGTRWLERTRQQTKNAEADYVRAGGTLTSCPEQGSVVPIASATGPLRQQAQVLNRHCQRLARVWNETEGLYAPASNQPALLGCVMGAPDRCSGETDGLVFEAYRELAEVDSLIAANTKMAAATRTHLAALEKTYQCAVERERAPGPTERVRDAAKLVNDFVGVLPTSGAAVKDKLGSAASPATSAAASEPAAATANVNPECPGGSQERLSFAGLLGKAGLTPEDLSAILARTDEVGGADGVAAALSEAKQQFAESRLATVLQAVVPASAPDAAATTPAAASGQPVDPAAVAAAGVVSAINPLYRIARVRSGDLPETRAILTDLAMARYEQSRARIELDRLNRSREFLQLRANARLQQAASLQAALGYTDPCRYLPADGKKSCKQPPQRERALIALADAWNRGAVPAAAAEVDLRGIDYASLMSREQAAVTADYAVLDPLVTELQIYAAGGFTADEIARAISAAGIVAIAVGVN